LDFLVYESGLSKTSKTFGVDVEFLVVSPGVVLQDLWCSLRHSRVYGSAHTPSSRGSSHRKPCGCIFEPIIDRGWWQIGTHLFHHLYLAVEGQVIHVLVYHQLRQK